MMQSGVSEFDQPEQQYSRCSLILVAKHCSTLTGSSHLLFPCLEQGCVLYVWPAPALQQLASADVHTAPIRCIGRRSALPGVLQIDNGAGTDLSFVCDVIGLTGSRYLHIALCCCTLCIFAKAPSHDGRLTEKCKEMYVDLDTRQVLAQRDFLNFLSSSHVCVQQVPTYKSGLLQFYMTQGACT